MRKIITGYPRTGKTTLASEETDPDVKIWHTDDVAHLGWSDASFEVSRWFNRRDPWIVEGVTCPRALRKWLRNNDGKPCDTIIFLSVPHVELTEDQETMSKGIDTVWESIEPKLIDRGVTIDRR